MNTVQELQTELQQLASEYTIQNGIIMDAGKFEGEPVLTLYAYHTTLDGMNHEQSWIYGPDGDHTYYEHVIVTSPVYDHVASIAQGQTHVLLKITSDGFVTKLHSIHDDGMRSARRRLKGVDTDSRTKHWLMDQLQMWDEAIDHLNELEATMTCNNPDCEAGEVPVCTFRAGRQPAFTWKPCPNCSTIR